ncbi:tetratricopeptide repeat protein [Marivirga harenae]|uniref:tetratricopeptide repeat protein n=1 Tax=Marivirga harenae TaxID=2010992 RepID=UPI0026DFA761|nr:tetratricopeptide repeat protein [Marivirga harenae]WKV11696.1 tetratricopeptide repeat protein [Marivirga harenae]|tara:strand:- start:198763 stop:199356 length:594 start_codon:yes stop_codon:yes gene_type:complete
MKNLVLLLIFPVFFFSCEEKNELDKANQLYNEENYEAAIQFYNKHLEMKPADEIAIYNRGRAYEELGQYDKAVQDFLEVIDIDPRNTGAFLSYGKHFYREKDYENAAFQFEKAYKLNTNSTRSATLLARAYHKAGKVEDAMEYYNIAINNDKDNAEAYLYRGALKVHLNQSGACNDIQLAKNIGYDGAEELYNKYCN